MESQASPSSAPISEAKLAANRANAQRSTGPRTPEGLARSSKNAVKHGLFSRSLQPTAELYGESREEYDAFLAELRVQYAPRGIEEHMIVDKIARQWWMQARVCTVGQRRVALAAKAGSGLSDATREAFPYDSHDLRLERSVSRLRRDLQFLQRLRDGENCKHTRPVAATFAQMTRLHEEEAEAIRRRIDAEREREEAARKRDGLTIVHMPVSIAEPPSDSVAASSHPVAQPFDPAAQLPHATAPSPVPTPLLQRIAVDVATLPHDARPLRERLGLVEAAPRKANRPRRKAAHPAAEPRDLGFAAREPLAASGD